MTSTKRALAPAIALGVLTALMVMWGALMTTIGYVLFSLGAPWFILVPAIAMGISGVLLAFMSPITLPFYAIFVVAGATLTIWQADLDWWPLLITNIVIAVLGLVLLTPFIRRALHSAPVRVAAISARASYDGVSANTGATAAQRQAAAAPLKAYSIVLAIALALFAVMAALHYGK